MCKACKMDPQDVQRLYARQGAVGVEDFDDEVRYRHPKRRSGKKPYPRSATRQPCPVAEDGKHVYVWADHTPDYSYYDNDKVFLKHFGYAKREIKTCCGCMVTSGSSRLSERYMKIKERKWRKLTGGEFSVKRGEPVQRWGRWAGGFYGFTWESYDEAYMEKVREEEAKRKAERAKYNSYMEYLTARRKALGL
jgi:hypothetical protein